MPNIRTTKYDQLVYSVEHGMPVGARFADMEACREYVRSVVGSDFWKNIAPSRTAVKVLSTKGTKYAYTTEGRDALYLPEWGWTELTILHELAHQVVYARHGSGHMHNGYFVYWFARLLEHFMGPETLNTYVERSLAVNINPWGAERQAEQENKGRVAYRQIEERGPVYYSRPPAGYITVAEVHRRLKAEGRSISSFVKAFGGDKGEGTPLSEHWKPIYAAGQRWLPGTCLQHFDDIAFSRKSTRSRWGR